MATALIGCVASLLLPLEPSAIALPLVKRGGGGGTGTLVIGCCFSMMVGRASEEVAVTSIVWYLLRLAGFTFRSLFLIVAVLYVDGFFNRFTNHSISHQTILN